MEELRENIDMFNENKFYELIEIVSTSENDKIDLNKQFQKVLKTR